MVVALLGCTPGAGWFVGVVPPDPAGLRAGVGRARSLPGPVTVEVWVADGADVGPAEASTAAAEHWWRAAGVELELQGTRTTSLPLVLGGDGAALDRQSAGLSPDRADDLMLDAVLAPLRAWLASRPSSGARVDLVVVPEIVGPGSPVARVADDLAGFTVAPGLVAELAQEQPDFATKVAARLGPGLTPTVFVSSAVLGRVDSADARWVVTHELGHALGLAHDDGPDNLMGARLYRCRPGLRPDQAARLRW